MAKQTAKQAEIETANTPEETPEAATKTAETPEAAADTITSPNEAGTGDNTPAPTLTATTKVYCKLPHGIEFTAGGVKVTLKGAYDKNAVAGFGITVVDAETWEAIAKAHAKHPAIAKNLIFAREKDGESKAKELAGEKTGFEKLNAAAPSAGVKPEKV
jgi:hypothetical protein